MKKLFLFLGFILFINPTFSQNIAFEQVGIKVEPGKAPYVLNLLDDFYGSIEKPNNVSISLIEYTLNLKVLRQLIIFFLQVQLKD